MEVRGGCPAGRQTELSMLRTVLEIIAGICGLYLTFVMVYQIVIGVFGFGKAEKD